MKEYRVIYDTENFIDGFDVDTEEDAIEGCKDTYIEWMMEERSQWSAIPTVAQIENWDYMIYNCAAWVEKYDPETGEYIPCWEPDDEYLTSIGWDTLGEE